MKHVLVTLLVTVLLAMAISEGPLFPIINLIGALGLFGISKLI